VPDTPPLYPTDADDARAAVQINGVDVRTREQAIQMFAQSRDVITLLLARPTTQVSQCCRKLRVIAIFIS